MVFHAFAQVVDELKGTAVADKRFEAKDFMNDRLLLLGAFTSAARAAKSAVASERA